MWSTLQWNSETWPPWERSGGVASLSSEENVLELGGIRTHDLGKGHHSGKGSLSIETKISSLCGRCNFDHGPLGDWAASSVL